MRRALLAVVSTVAGLVLLLSFKTTSAVSAPTVAARPAAQPTADPGTPSAKRAATAGPTATAGSATAVRTLTGTAVDTRYGAVQVQITMTGSKVTAAQAVEYPENDSHDAQINAYAIPVLQQETVQAGSASIDMVSGATYTSEGYIQSLQSALDQA